jgi:shikimate kinase
MKNIVLIGMPGAGKSTIGVLLAKSMLRDFCDTDLIIQKKEGKALCEIIKEKGTEEFIRIEDEIIGAQKFENCVVATGGSAVYGEDAMRNLKANGKAVYLKLSPEEIEKRIDNIATRGIVMGKGSSISELYLERAPLYERYADITAECSGLGIEDCVTMITESLDK